MNEYPQPFNHKLFADIAKHVAPPPPEDIQVLAPLSSQAKVSPPKRPVIEDFHLVSSEGGDPRSDFYANQASSAYEQEVESEDHFNFIPGVDKVLVAWKVTYPELVVKVKWELFSVNKKEESLWSLEVDEDVAEKLQETPGGELEDLTGNLKWEGVEIGKVTIGENQNAFPDKIATLEHAPYQLRMTISSKSEDEAPFVAWTYFDIIVDSIELHWGEEALIPDEDIEGVQDIYKELTARDEKALLAGFKENTTKIDGDQELEILLRSTNAAYISLQEWYSHADFAYLRYKARWGDGPRMPILAKLFLKDVNGERFTPDSAGQWQSAGQAMGSVQLLWDWHDKSEADRRAELDNLDAKVKNFIMKGLKYEEDLEDEPPGCLNCHGDRGGKRGFNDEVFPIWFEEKVFPFEVDPCDNRDWAVYSRVKTEGDYVGQTGVIFQPSRIAKDSYKIHVFLASAPYAASLDTKDKIQKLLEDHPDHPEAHTGMMEVLRQIDARYIRKGNNTPRMDLDLITREYAVGGCKIVWQEEFWDKDDFDRCMAAAISPDHAGESEDYVRHKCYKKYISNHREFLKNEFEDRRPTVHAQFAKYDQWFGCKAGETLDSPGEANFTVAGRNEVEKPFIAAETKRHIYTNRFINWPKRKWNKYKRNKTESEEDLLFQFYRRKLSRAERRELWPTIKQAYEDAKWKGATVPRSKPDEWAKENYYFNSSGLMAISREMHLRKVMEDKFEGVTFFHYTHFFEALKLDGSVYARQCDVGGVAAVAVNADLGLSGGFLVWDHPTNGQRQALKRKMCERSGTPAQGADGHTGGAHGECTFKGGNPTVVHEFGHFLHLPHAKPKGTGNEAAPHDQNNNKCVMNYDPDALHLCGGCALRLRGWAFFKHGLVKGFANNEPALEGSAPPKPDTDALKDHFDDFFADLIY